MKKIILVLATIIGATLVSCDEVVTESSEILKEKAIVVTLIHSPSEHNIDLTSTAYNTSGITGTDYNGNDGIKITKDLQITSTTIPEKFGVAFQCEHGTFTVEGSETKHKVLYEKLLREVGDTVTILYKEQYRVTYREENGQKKMVSKVLNKLDFIDAQK